MPIAPKASVSRVQWAILALLWGASGHLVAQTAPVTAAATAAAAPAPAASAVPQGLSESILRQAQGPYRMILNSPTVVRPKPVAPSATPVAARSATPVAAAPMASPLSSPTPLPIASSIASPKPSPIAAPVTPVEPATAQSPITSAAIAPSAVTAIAPPTAVLPPKPVATAIAAEERPLIAVRQEEPVLTGPLARERPTGVVQVGFNVNPNGSTGDVNVISSTNRRLNSAVVNAVAKWVYQPLEAVRRLEVAIEFKND